MDLAVVTEPRDALEHRRSGHAFRTKDVEQLAEQRLMLVTPRFAEDYPQEDPLAFDASHVGPPSCIASGGSTLRLPTSSA